MKRILFVDDEPHVLDGLRGLLRKQRKEWQMTFALGGEQALRELATTAFDMIVSDMRMPDVDGATLLRKVQQEYPHIIRIVLSGQTEQDITRRMVHVAHQFLAKPFDGQELQQVIERAFKLSALLAQPALRSSVGQIGGLPMRPGLFARLTEVMESPKVTMADAAAVIESDPASSAKLLQVCNSAFFGLRRRVVDVRAAVSSLGLDLVKALVLSVEVGQLPPPNPCPGYDVDAADRHSLLAARIARRLLADQTAADEAFSAAKLKDIGALVLISHQPDEFRRIVELARTSGRPLWQVEGEVLGVTHFEIGAYLLGIWGLPHGVVEPVAYHHAPQRVTPTELDPLCAVHVATALAQEVDPPDRSRHIGGGVALDAVLLERLNLTPLLPSWRQIAAEEAQAASAQRARV
jgi:HD-like signal output (HDOD) protein/CheY-like chemotaxis protein